MTCDGKGNSSFNTMPFGYLRGPYDCNQFRCRFSGSALADMRRNGYSDEFIDSLLTTPVFNPVDGNGGGVRPVKPQSIEVYTGQQQAEIDALVEQRRQLTAQLGEKLAEQTNPVWKPGMMGSTFTSTEPSSILQRKIASITEQINDLRGTAYTINGLDLVADSDNKGVDDNILNCYIDVQYHVSLTMLSQASALKFQMGRMDGIFDVDLNTMKSDRRTDSSITLASTGENFTNTRYTDNTDMLQQDGRSDRNYYNIESLIVKNITEPSKSNPLVSNMISMKMRLAEPHGMKLHEDIRDTAEKLDYTDINPGRILYRVDIGFSGYNQDTGEWEERIDLGRGDGTYTISTVMGISAIEAEVTTSGTMYELDLVPAGHHAYRPEDFILDANTMSSGPTFRDFLRNLSKAMKAAKETRTQFELIRNYEFFAPKMLLDSPFDMSAFKSDNQFLFAGGDPDHGISTGQNIDLLTLLQGAIANTLVAQELFIADQNNEMFKIPRIHFTVRFNTIYGSSDGAVTVDSGLNDYKEITHQYLIEPYITFKHGMVSQESIDEYVAPNSQIQRVREIIRMGMLRRIYNYMYTEENTEVIDFDVKLKAFYYNSLNLSSLTSSSGRSNYSTSPDEALGNASVINDLFRVKQTVDSTIALENDNIMDRLFRSSTKNSCDASSRTGASRLGGGFNETPATQLFGDITSDPVQQRRNDYETFMADYLELDLLQLKGMKVRGDPVWLLSPYSNKDMGAFLSLPSSEGVAELSPISNISVRARSGQIIYLRLSPPEQQDLMNPDRNAATSCPTVIGGFYQVTEVTSTFAGGIFTQEIEGVKLNHLNYAEELFDKGDTDPFSSAIENALG